ncbi:hypothetical protein DL771_008594 [Monosporascus sp. 5C6A]|nr:hypothetical protein DL771_008594 [Monosporascus sp. 5C6A]
MGRGNGAASEVRDEKLPVKPELGRDTDAEPKPVPKGPVALMDPVPKIVESVVGPLNGSVELGIGNGADSEVVTVMLPEVIVANDKLPLATPVELRVPVPGTEDGRTVDIPVPAPDIVSEPIAGKVELSSGNGMVWERLGRMRLDEGGPRELPVNDPPNVEVAEG